MVELCLMASHGYPPGLGVVFHPEQGFSRGSKDLQHCLHYSSPNQELVNFHSLNLRLQRNEELKSTGGLLDFNHFVTMNSCCRRSVLDDARDTHPGLLLFGFGIAKQCTKQENILKLLTSGSLEVEDGLLDLSMLHGLVEPQQPDQQFSASYSKWRFTDPRSQHSLIYPTKEIYMNESLLDLVGPTISITENARLFDGQLQYSCNGTEMNDIISAVSDMYLSKNAVKSKPTMLVPYFERRRRARSNADSSKVAAEKATQIKSHEKVKEKKTQKRKANSRTGKERNFYSTGYLHACESLLSTIVDRKQDGKSTIPSLKKSGPQLSQLLTQISASIAGTGIAVVLSVLCRVACSRVPFCASNLLSTGLGLGLVWLSWGVNKLRDTVASICKSSGKMGDKEDEMMGHLDRSLKDVYFRAAVVMAVVVLRLA